MKLSLLLAPALVTAALLQTQNTRADAVTDWNEHLEEAVFATAQPVPAQGRSAAIVHLAIFEAVNGITRDFQPYCIDARAPHGARAEAAAVQAAYTSLSALYPAHQQALDAHLADSLAQIPGSCGRSTSIARGRAWGEQVALHILALRNNDGWTTPQPAFMGGFEPGQWRSVATGANADGTLPAVFPQNAILTPFVMSDPSQFRPEPPYGAELPGALLSPRYARDLDEVKAVGRIDSALRTAEQTDIALLWQAMGPIDENRAARSVIPRHARLVDNARLFALLNMVACDALIIGWDSKFAYQLWRPHHAIRLADTDGNPATVADPTWSALILAPRFPEYVSNHSTLTAAIMRVLARELGDAHRFTLGSPLKPGFVQEFKKFSDAAAQAMEARLWGGIHFRTACEVGNQLGVELADAAIESLLTPMNRRR
ncbi:MAG: vanadium-dependent haloperoxidase [Verrucomicrobiales bacterium]|nr:vanadium-dependent haloperoxidase [Verrucomicrobiales bacterium]